MLKNTESVENPVPGLSSDSADVEIEISAEDLLALSPTPPAAEANHAASTSTQAPAPDVTATPIKLPQPPHPPSQKTPPPSRRRSSRAALWLCGVTAALGVVAIALYTFVTPVRASRPLLSENPVGVAQEEWPPLPTPEAELREAEEEPVRFVNPFDSDEVFEFPQGTTVAEARAAVAEVLAKRAMERLGSR